MMKVLPPSSARQYRISSDTFGAFNVSNSYIMNIVLANTCYKKTTGWHDFQNVNTCIRKV